MDIDNVVYAHNWILFGLKKEGTLSFVIPWMELEVIILNEII